MPLNALTLRHGHPYQDKRSPLPLELVTGTGADPRPRLRVDQGDTAFYEGRQFASAHEFSLTAGTSVWLRFVVPIDIIVKRRKLTMLQGSGRAVLRTGGTEGGAWTAKSPFNVNSASNRPAYTRQVTASSGGTVAGSVEAAVALVAETGNGQAISVVATADEYGLSAGTYYIEISNPGTGAARGQYESVWEEIQPRSSIIY